MEVRHLSLVGRPVEAVRLRSVSDYELTSDDGLVDWVAVDRALRGRPVQLTRDELDEVCRVIDDLRREYHEDGVPIGRYDDPRSPYLILKSLLVDAYGPQFETVYDRYKDKIRQRERRARRRAAEKEMAA